MRPWRLPEDADREPSSCSYTGGVWDQAETLPGTNHLLISAAGPLASVAASVVLSTVARTVVAVTSPAGEVLVFGALVNFVLGLINMLPAEPFDGGRMLLSVLWGATRDARRARRIAGVVGQMTAAILVGVGVAQVMAGSIFSGLGLSLSAWFIATGAVRSRQQQSLRDELSALHVAELMDTRPAFATSDMTVAEFVREHALRGGRLELVVLEDGRLAGLVNVAAVRTLPEECWSSTPVARIMHRAPLPTLSPEGTLDDAVGILAHAPFAQLPVVREGLVVGMLGSDDVARFQWLRARLRFQVGDPHTE